MPEVEDEVLVTNTNTAEAGIKFEAEVTDYFEGGPNAAKWELSELDAARAPGYIGETEKDQVWDDTGIAHVTVPKLDGTSKEAAALTEADRPPAEDALSIESIEIAHEGVAAPYNPKELWEAAHRTGDPRVSDLDAPKNEVAVETLEVRAADGPLSLNFEEVRGIADDDGPSTLLGDLSAAVGGQAQLGDVAISHAHDLPGDDDSDSFSDLEIDV